MSVGGVIAERWYIVRPDDRVSCLYEAYRKAQGINTGRVRIFALKDGRSVELDEDSQSFAVNGIVNGDELQATWSLE